MIVIRMELWPLGDKNKSRSLGTAVIANDGSGTLSEGNYDVVFSGKKISKQPWRKCRVEGFPRLRLGAWDLLFRALRSCVGDRNEEKDSQV